LIDERYPVYAEADVAVDIDDSPPDVTTNRVRAAIEAFMLAQEGPPDTETAGSGSDGGPDGGLPARDLAP
jgi:hypothetical protein